MNSHSSSGDTPERLSPEQIAQGLRERVAVIKLDSGNVWFGWTTQDMLDTADTIATLLRERDEAIQHAKDLRTQNWGLMADASHVLVAINAERKANERAEAAETEAQTLRVRVQALEAQHEHD